MPTADGAAPRDRVVEDAAEVFGLLGDPSRLRLLPALRGGERAVGELAAEAGLSESAASHALALLRAHRVVASRRDGRRVLTQLDDPHVRDLLDLALAHAGHVAMTHPEHHEHPEHAADGRAGGGR